MFLSRVLTSKEGTREDESEHEGARATGKEGWMTRKRERRKEGQ
jgi:hypothetical protein